MTNISNLFKFIEVKRPEYTTPFKFKLIHDTSSLTKDELKVKGGLDLSDININSLPDGLTVEGGLVLSDTNINSLPEGLTVGGSLYLDNTKITSLPDGLIVGDDIDLSFTRIDSLPYGLTVGGDIDLSETPLSEQYSEDEILKIIQDKEGNVKGEILI